MVKAVIVKRMIVCKRDYKSFLMQVVIPGVIVVVAISVFWALRPITSNTSFAVDSTRYVEIPKLETPYLSLNSSIDTLLSYFPKEVREY